MTDSEMLDWLQSYATQFIQHLNDDYELKFMDKNAYLHIVTGQNIRDCISGAIIHQKQINDET